MISITMDKVSYRCVLNAMHATCYGPSREFEFNSDPSERIMEALFMASVGAMVACGAVTHHFDNDRKIDVFQSTERLVRHWGWLFPGNCLEDSIEEEIVIELSGGRSRHFKKGWDAPDADDPPPAWPD